MRPIILSLLLVLAPAAAVAGPGPGPAGCLPRVQAPWVRMAPAAMPMGAGFATIINPCRQAVVIVGAETPAFREVGLHETRVENGVSRMRAVPALVVPAGARIELKPGGRHLMLMEPNRVLDNGKFVRLDFRLRDGRAFGADFPVRDAAP